MGRGEWAENGSVRKIAPKSNEFGIMWTPLGDTARCDTFLESSFQGRHFHRESFKSNTASKLTILKKSLHKFNVFGIIADNPGMGYRLMPYIHFRKIFSRETFASPLYSSLSTV